MVPKSAVMDELALILASAGFTSAPRLSRLLRFIAERSLETGAPKEYEIGLKVFDRDEDYDPRQDPVVRVEVRQLRFKLAAYYAVEGASDPLIIDIPKGGYLAQFTPCHPIEEASPAPTLAAEPPPSPPVTAAPARPLSVIPPATPSRAHWRFLANRIPLASAAVLCLLAVWAFAAHDANHSRHLGQTLDLTGRYYWNKRTPEDLHSALNYFQEAVAKNPADAEAYSGLADTYNLLTEYTVFSPHQAFSSAISAANRAVQLDDDLAEAHASLGFALFYGEFDFFTADRELRRAIELDNSYAAAHHWRATMLMSVGQPLEALSEITSAQQLDPGSRSILADKGLILSKVGQRIESRQLLEQLASDEPSFMPPHRYLAEAALLDRDFPRYLAESEITARLVGDIAAKQTVAAEKSAYETGGESALYSAGLTTREQLIAKGSSNHYEAAQLAALTGQNDRSLAHLRTAIACGELMVVAIPTDHLLDSLRSDPAFVQLLRTSLPVLTPRATLTTALWR